jgi:hypothetical protein
MIITLFLLKYNTVKNRLKNHDFKSDIIISPCGFYGLYNLGICHYLKNNFKIKDKKIAGISSGSFNAIFLCLNKKKSTIMIKELFRLNNIHKKKNIRKYAEDVLKSIENNFILDDIYQKNLYIGLSHINNLVFYHDFKNIRQLLQCCMGSSFIPGITHKDLIYFYEKKYTLDGAFWYRHYKKHIDNEKTLVISPRTFGRYKGVKLAYDSFFRKNLNLYNLYLNGYHDARKNHDYFKKYLEEK